MRKTQVATLLDKAIFPIFLRLFFLWAIIIVAVPNSEISLFPTRGPPLFFFLVVLQIRFQLWPSDHTQTVMRNSNVVCPVRDAARGEGASRRKRKRKRKRRKGDGGHLVIRADPKNRPLGSRPEKTTMERTTMVEHLLPRFSPNHEESYTSNISLSNVSCCE